MSLTLPAELDIASPWTFELISNKERTIKTHAGVLEFHGEEGNVYLPSWVRLTGAILF